MSRPRCRACGARAGHVVLDLGTQPACDYFPLREDPGPDAVYPLQMWLCSECSLAQLVADATSPEEPRGAESAALKAQAVDAVERVAAAGWLPRGARVTEYGSPHGGSWAALLEGRGLSSVIAHDTAHVVIDCFGMMHCADQAAAMADRAARLADGGVLLLQYHSLATIVGRAQWNALRHGHFAYYSTTVLCKMLSAAGLRPRMAWQFDLYGGTVLLGATRRADAEADVGLDASVQALLMAEDELGVTDPLVLGDLQRSAVSSAEAVHDWLVAQQASGRTVLGYGAASRAVALLCRAGVGIELLAAVADASPAKWGRRMPGTGIPIIHPEELISATPDVVLLFLPDLLTEVRTNLPYVEASGGCWVDVENLISGHGLGSPSQPVGPSVSAEVSQLR